MSEPISCRSEEGITIGLIDAVISICRILANRDFSSVQVQEALKDLVEDEDLEKVLNKARLAHYRWKE